jgi:FkbM family methyltransferase
MGKMIDCVRKMARVLGYEIKRSNFYTRPDQRLQSLLSHHQIDVLLDIGAHDGTYGYNLLANGFQGTVISFEAQPNVYEKLLQKSVAFGDRWIVAPRSAVGDVHGTLRFYVTAATASSSTQQPHNATESMAEILAVKEVIEVESRRLDEFDILKPFRGKRLFAKIDVQGAEDKVYRGASGIISDVCGMTVEMSLVSYYTGQLLAGPLHAMFTESGFELWDLEPVLRNNRTGKLEQYDATYFRSN